MCRKINNKHIALCLIFILLLICNCYTFHFNNDVYKLKEAGKYIEILDATQNISGLEYSSKKVYYAVINSPLGMVLIDGQYNMINIFMLD